MKHILAIALLAFSLTAKADYSISGISSGGFMAAQMGVIYSDHVTGVGTVAGGVFFCARNHFPVQFNKTRANGLFLAEWNSSFFATPQAFLIENVSDYFKQLFRIAPQNPTYQAVGVCMAQPELAHAASADQPMDLGFVDQFYENGLIASPGGIRAQRIFVYHGEKDDVVRLTMASRMEEFYLRFGVPRENLRIEIGSGGHNFPTVRDDGIACDTEAVPYVASCGNDIAGKILAHLGARELARGAYQTANLYKVNQRTNLYSDSLAEYGYLYAPPECLEEPGRCPLHVALHGCKMSDSYDEDFEKLYEQKIATAGILYVISEEAGLTGWNDLPNSPLSLSQRVPRMGALRFALDSGYGEYAEANPTMILFPQTQITVKNYPLNPKGCWDWYGWTETENVRTQGDTMGSLYATNRGYETSWLDDFAEKIRQDPKPFLLPWEQKEQDIARARAIR